MLLTIAHQGLQPAGRGRRTSRSSRRRPPSWSSRSTTSRSSAAPTATSASTSGPILVWRATTEASYLEDARVGEVLRQRGKTLEGIAFLLDLWREYPVHGVDPERLLRPGAGRRRASPARPRPTRPSARELAAAGATRSDLLLQAIRLDQAFLAQSPEGPAGRRGEPGPGRRVPRPGGLRRRGEALAALRRALPQEHVPGQLPVLRGPGPVPPRRVRPRDRGGRDDRRRRPTRTPTASTSPARTSGRPSTSSARSTTPAASRRKALAYYERVADRFTDAAGAVKALTRKELKLPEVSVDPARPRRGGRGRGRPPQRCPPQKPDDAKPRTRTAAKLDYRNIADGRREGLSRRPDAAVPDPPQPRRRSPGSTWPGSSRCTRRRSSSATARTSTTRSGRSTCPLKKEGAYLVMVRGDDLYASGIVLVSPLELEVLEEPESGRVRVTVRDARTKALRAQGAGEGDRLGQPGVLLGRDRPARRVRGRGRARPGHGRGPQGRRTSTPSTAGRPSSARSRPPRSPARHEPAGRPATSAGPADGPPAECPRPEHRQPEAFAPAAGAALQHPDGQGREGQVGLLTPFAAVRAVSGR